MSDPTLIVVTATFLAAFGLFVLVATTRRFLVKNPLPTAPQVGWDGAVPPLQIPAALDENSPYQPPLQAPLPVSLPPPLPTGRVPTWFYHPLDLLGIGFVFVMFFGLVASSVWISSEKEIVLDPAALLGSIAFQFITAGIVTATVISRVRPVQWLGLKWHGWRWIFLIAPGSVLVMWVFFGGLQAAGFMQWVESFGVEAVQDTVKILQESQDPVLLGLMAFAAVIAAPICEEIVFRGYLYSASKRFTGPWAAGICSALVFAAAHGSLAALLPLFVFGCVLAFLYEKTGSLWAPVAVHFCFNGATVLIQMIARFYDIPLDPTP